LKDGDCLRATTKYKFKNGEYLVTWKKTSLNNGLPVSFEGVRSTKENLSNYNHTKKKEPLKEVENDEESTDFKYQTSKEIKEMSKTEKEEEITSSGNKNGKKTHSKKGVKTKKVNEAKKSKKMVKLFKTDQITLPEETLEFLEPLCLIVRDEANKIIELFWHEDELNALKKSKKKAAWKKILERIEEYKPNHEKTHWPHEHYLPSRIKRSAYELAGRTLLQQADRFMVYSEIIDVLNNEPKVLKTEPITEEIFTRPFPEVETPISSENSSLSPVWAAKLRREICSFENLARMTVEELSSKCQLSRIRARNLITSAQNRELNKDEINSQSRFTDISEEEPAIILPKTLASKINTKLKKEGVFEKYQYILNITEQLLNFMELEGRLPNNYFELQSVPLIKIPMITYASDDGLLNGNTYRLSVDLTNKRLIFKAKYPKISNPVFPSDWVSIGTPHTITLAIPKILEQRLSSGAKQKAPNLRIINSKGKKRIVLDFITSHEVDPPEDSNEVVNFLAYDWGVRKLITFVVVNSRGEQLSRPFFFRIDILADKQLRRRKQISYLKKVKNKLDTSDPLKADYAFEIKLIWEKYSRVNLVLGHIASLIAVDLARIYNCQVIVGENLKSLRRTKKGKNPKASERSLNWKVNSAIKSAIWFRIIYKAQEQGICSQLISPEYTSQVCPRCGSKGKRTKSPEHHDELDTGVWFNCINKECGYNADRDYIAALNIARKAFDKDHSNWHEPKQVTDCHLVSYIGTPASLPFPSPESVRRFMLNSLSGFTQICVKPSFLRLGKEG
jgi:transposase